jgi:hypothetical protein
MRLPIADCQLPIWRSLSCRSLAACPATRAIICRYRSATANNLLGNRTTSIVTSGNGPRQLDDPQGEGFGPRPQFGGIHGAKPQTQSAIGNRQSEIPL